MTDNPIPIGWKPEDERIRRARIGVLGNMETMGSSFSPALHAAVARYPRQRITQEFIDKKALYAWANNRAE